MRQITVRQARRELSEARVKEWLPFQLVCDGMVIAVVLPQHDVRQAIKAKHGVNKANDLPFSKARQLSHTMSH